jgi:hypothetical protein
MLPVSLNAVAGDALEWACLLHMVLMCVHWAPEVLASPAGREVYGEQGELLFRGIRARVGIYKVCTGTTVLACSCIAWFCHVLWQDARVFCSLQM